MVMEPEEGMGEEPSEVWEAIRAQEYTVTRNQSALARARRAKPASAGSPGILSGASSGRSRYDGGYSSDSLCGAHHTELSEHESGGRGVHGGVGSHEEPMELESGLTGTTGTGTGGSTLGS